MVSVIASSVVVRVFEPRSGQTKDYAVSICCFSTQHAVFKEKEKNTGWFGIKTMCSSGTAVSVS
jgi:hypothetical protein